MCSVITTVFSESSTVVPSGIADLLYPIELKKKSCRAFLCCASVHILAQESKADLSWTTCKVFSSETIELKIGAIVPKEWLHTLSEAGEQNKAKFRQIKYDK